MGWIIVSGVELNTKLRVFVRTDFIVQAKMVSMLEKLDLYLNFPPLCKVG